MRTHGVPEWYIESCRKIQYLFPKAHAVAYVTMAFRIAWFKVHRPLAFYATYFTIRAKAFDAEYCCAGLDAVRKKIHEIESNKDATAVEQDMMVTLEVCYEFYLRGFHFEPISIYESDATKFKVVENGLLPPFTSVHGLGEAVALDTVEKRKGKQFISIEEFSICCNKLSKTHMEQLKALGAFAGMIDWRVALVVWGGFLLLSVLTRYVSLGSVYAGTAFPFATWFVFHSVIFTVLSGICGGLLVWQHRANIRRLCTGTESKFSFHRKSEEKK